jgi:hypothetical protein
MAPARPMMLVWAAVNRIGLSGETVLGPEERIETKEAFQAVTLEAAHALRKENEIGSIEIGKKANFTVFEENPVTPDPATLKNLAIWGTVHEGEKYPIAQASRGLVMSEAKQESPAMLNDYQSRGVHRHHGDACTANQIFQAGASAYGN